jgi:hypothetical protein
MKKTLPLISAVVVAICLTGCVTVPSPSSAVSQSLVAERPIHHEGDWALYLHKQGGLSRWDISRALSDRIFLWEGGEGQDIMVTSDSNPVKRIDGKSGKILFEAELPYGRHGLKFPFRVGENWEFSYEALGTNGKMITFDVTCEVSNVERVILENGKEVTSFLIIRDWQARGYADHGRNVLRYALEAGMLLEDNEVVLIDFG